MRSWQIAQALGTVRQLMGILPKLTDEEIAHVISVEEAAQNRATCLDKLYREQRQRARKPFIR